MRGKKKPNKMEFQDVVRQLRKSGLSVSLGAKKVTEPNYSSVGRGNKGELTIK